MPLEEKPNVFALQAKRNQANTRVSRQRMTDAERIAELETEVDKLIQIVMEQRATLDDLDDRQWKLVRLIGKRLGLTGKAKGRR